MNEMARLEALHLINILNFAMKRLEDAINLEEADVINFALIGFASGVAWAKEISTQDRSPDFPVVHAAPHSANIVHVQDPTLAAAVHAAPPSTHIVHVQNPAPVVPHATTRTGTDMIVNISVVLEDMNSLREGGPQHTASSSKRTTKRRERSVAQSNVTKKCRMTS